MIFLVDSQNFAKRFELGLQKLAASAGQINAYESFEKATASDSSVDFQRIGSTALIPICGPLSYKYDFWSWLSDGSSYQGLANKIHAAIGDESIERIVCTFDTPGGEHCGLPELADMLFAARDRKEIVACVDPMAASAGYWLASQCTRIVSMGTGMVGSLGTQIVIHSMHGMLEKLGYNMKVIRAAISPMKNIAHPYEPMKDEAIKYYQELTDKCGVDFVDAVARGRGVPSDKVTSDFGKGLMMFAPQAVKVGMIDAVSSVHDVLAESKTTKQAASAKAKYRASENLWRAL